MEKKKRNDCERARCHKCLRQMWVSYLRGNCQRWPDGAWRVLCSSCHALLRGRTRHRDLPGQLFLPFPDIDDISPEARQVFATEPGQFT